MAITYVHPSVTATITDESTTYVTSVGTTKLFAAFTSDRGADNEIVSISSASEFIFKYGEPNMKIHGQANYNILNWLNAGGGVFALRVLPENAGFSNASVNIQTKVGTKEVMNSVGKKVTIPNVTIRPTVTFIEHGNNSAESLEALQENINNSTTVDGFKNHVLFTVIPRGRGNGYNDLAFRISNAIEYDNTYDFRVFNFSIGKITSTSGYTTIEGPYKVALDPEALSNSNESMFIKNVVERYSEYFDIIFNEAAYDELAAIINPNVHPGTLDLINFTNRESDTFYSYDTKSEENILINAMSYDIDSQRFGDINTVDTDDDVDKTIVSSDNDYRLNDYNLDKDTLDKMILSLNRIMKIKGDNNPYRDTIDHLCSHSHTDGSSHTGEIETKLNAAVTKYQELKDAQTAYKGNVSKDTLNTYKAKIDEYEDAINEFIDIVKDAIAYGAANTDTSTVTDLIDLKANLKVVEGYITSINNIRIKLASYRSALQSADVEAVDSVDSIKINEDSPVYDYIVYAGTVLGNMSSSSMNNDVETEADTTLASCNAKYAELVSLFEDINIDYIDSENYVVKAGDIKTAINDLTALLNDAIDLVVIENAMHYYSLFDTEANDIYSLANGYICSAYDNITSSSNVLPLKSKITLFENELTLSANNTYSHALHNFDNQVTLLFGNDGDLELTNKDRTKAVNSLLIKAYTGQIDSTLLDYKMVPIDMLLDANYDTSVKNALIELATVIRDDIFCIVDTGFQGTPAQAIQYRQGSLGVSSNRVGIFTQDLIVHDDEYTAQSIKVTPTYFLATKIPYNDNNNGIQYNFVGPRRGIISGFEKLSFNPNIEWKEQLYKAQINYIEQEPTRTKFGSQLTSQNIVSALSDINNVRCLLRIVRDVKYLMEDYQFEYNDRVTISAAQSALDSYLDSWISNRACTSITGDIYASEYDIKQKTLRVKIEVTFNYVIEKIAIDIVVK